MRADLVVASYLRTRRAMRLSPPDLARHRERQWRRLASALARTPALAEYAARPLAEFPVIEPAHMRADYGPWNSLGLADEALRTMADRAELGELGGPLAVGWSTGSGDAARGLFIADGAERADYIGQSLARALPPRALLRRQRLALHLRANSALYRDAGGRRLAFRHFPLGAPVDQTMADIRAFSPTILIAPPYRLLAFAEVGRPFTGLSHLFYGSEPMSEAERAHVAEQLGVEPRPIYQATEGFLGAACANGRLHLNEHALEIELEPVPDTQGFRPIVTDLRRRSQPIVRMRGDDYLELDGKRCSCGFAGRVIRPVAGRVQDIWRFAAGTVTPPEVVAAVESELDARHRWQAMASPREIILRTASDCPQAARMRAAQKLEQTGQLHMRVETRPDLAPWHGPKRRKVVWSNG